MPLTATTAAFLASVLVEGRSIERPYHAVVWGGMPVVDPFCGLGTYL